MEKNFRAHLETTNYYSVRVVLLILYTATERSLDTSAVVETNKPLTSCTNACRWNTPGNFHYHYPICSSCLCTCKVVLSVDISLGWQIKMISRANEKRRSIAVVRKVKPWYQMKMNRSFKHKDATNWHNSSSLQTVRGNLNYPSFSCTGNPLRGEQITQAESMRNTEWATHNCVLGYPVIGK